MHRLTWNYGRVERKVFPGWLFLPGNEELRRIYIIAYSTAFIAFPALVVIGYLRLLRQDTVLGMADLLFAAVLAGLVLHHRRTKAHDDHLTARWAVAAYGTFCLYLLFFNEFGRTTFLWSYTFPLMVFPILGCRRGGIAVGLFLLSNYTLLALGPCFSFITDYSNSFIFSYTPSIFAVSGLSYLYERNREKNQCQLELANAALQKSNEEMERQVQERTAELAQSEKNYRFLTESMSDMVWTVDLNLDVTYVSPSVTKILGFTPEEYRSRPFRDRVKPESFKKAMAVFAVELMKEKMPETDPQRNLRIEVELRHKKGSTVWMELLMNAIRDDAGTLVGIHGVSRDITKRKEAENELRLSEERFRDSEEKYRRLVENAEDAVLIAQDGAFRFVNPAGCRISGYEVNELMKTSFIDLIHPEDRTRVMDIYRAHMQGNPLPDYYEFRGIAKDGSERCAAVKPVIIDWEGRPAVLAFVRDITKQKLLEAQLRQAQKMEAIGTLAGGIAHDFNNLLSGILGHATLLEMVDEATESQKERLRAIEELIKSASSLTSQLLGFARMGRYEVKTTDINEILDKTSVMFGRTHKEIVITRKYADDLLPVEVDRTQMEQVFMNLFVNSLQAMPGGGSIYIGTSNVTIRDGDDRLPYMAPGTYVKIVVVDTGMGMDAATKSRIFEPFFTTKEMGRGTGLGLAMVYGIVKGHEGYINVESEKGRGTTFEIHLPVSQKQPAKEQERIMEKLARGNETVLLVDDESQIIEVMGDILGKLGYKTFAASNGEEAVKIYRQQGSDIDLVILDLVMPGIGGGETLNRLRDLNPDVKVILSSGYSLDDQAGEVMNKGCRAFIQKPIDVGELSQTIREVLKG